MLVEFTAPLWIWHSQNSKGAAGSWYFVTLPEDQSAVIRMAAPPRGSGSVRVKAAIGESGWQTSIFFDRKRNAYMLPVKVEIRRAEGLEAGKPAEVRLRLDL